MKTPCYMVPVMAETLMTLAKNATPGLKARIDELQGRLDEPNPRHSDDFSKKYVANVGYRDEIKKIEKMLIRIERLPAVLEHATDDPVQVDNGFLEGLVMGLANSKENQAAA